MNESNGQGKVIDLNELVPDPVWVVLGDKRFDVARLPLRLAMQGIALQDAAERESVAAQFDRIIDWLLSVVKVTYPETDREWLLETIVSQAQLMGLLNAIMESAFGQATGGGEVALGEVTPEAVGGTDE